MTRKIIIALLAITTLQAFALDVTTTAGGLQDKISDMNVSTLRVTGAMNATDFYFIADHLLALTSIDLADVKIEGCDIGSMRFLNHTFAADEIPVGAFGDMKLTSVVLPTGLKSIGKAAFAGCDRLTAITFPASLERVGDYAFAGCSALTAITLPASVTTVGTGAFMRCTALTSLAVEPSSKLAELAATALMDCPALQTIELGPSLATVGERAFAGTGLRALDLTASQNLRQIGDWAMVLTPVEQAKLPASLTQLGDGAFLYDTRLTGITLGNKLSTINDYVLAGTALTGELNLPLVKTVGDYAFYNVSSLASVGLPATLTWLGDSAMAGMTGMTNLACQATKVPDLGQNVWAGVNQASVVLEVPSSSRNNYKMAAQWQDFFIAEPSWIIGDVNGDGEVNIADVNTLIDIILGEGTEGEILRRADVNQDGEINIADVNALIDIILNSSAKLAAVVDTDDALHMDDVTMELGDVRTLTVTLDNAEIYSSLQCDITLPQGLTLVGVSGIKGHETEADELGGASAASRVVVYSMDRIPFDADAAVLHITVRADGAIVNDSPITLTNVVLSGEDCQAWHANGCAARVTNATGINDLNADHTGRLWVEGRTLCIESHIGGMAQVVAINGAACELSLKAGVNRYELEPGFYVVVMDGKSNKIAIK